MSVRPARRWAAALAGAAALLLASCAGTPAGEDTSAAPDLSGPPTTASEAAFPVTVTSSFGDAVIEAKPERVVTLGWGADDIAVSLGTVPVGVEADTWAGDADGLRPWFRAAVEEQGADLPTAIAMYPELDVDAIVALEPDVIIAPQSAIDQAMFDQLSAFAPVVAAPGAPWATSVEDQVRVAAEALGVPERGEEILTERQAALDQVKADHPEFAETTFAYVYLGGEAGTLSVYMPGDTRVALLTAFGLQLDPAVADLEADPGTFVANLGLENADLLDDVDVLFTWFNDEAEQEAVESQELFARIPAFQSGAYVPMLDRGLGMAVSVATPLSIPWAIDEYLPVITEAVAQAS